MQVYLDNAATTPIHPKVIEKMLPIIKEVYGNPSSIHTYGRKVRVLIEETREIVADFINAKPSEIYFTSSGTEANNLAIFGIANEEYHHSGKNIIVSDAAEHQAVLEPIQELGKSGFNPILLDLNSDTSIKLNDITRIITPDTALVSIMHINNETGCINNLDKIINLCNSQAVIFHTDAVQSFGKIRIDVTKNNIDSLCGSGHKIFGPKGVGVLYLRSGTPLKPLIYGGSQERNRRAGTENPVSIIGLAEAVRIADKEMMENENIVINLKNYFMEGINSINKGDIIINGGDNTSPYILSITLNSKYYINDAEAMLIYLDLNGIAVSNGAACTSGTLKPSHVILSSGKSIDDANGTIRFSFSPINTKIEIDYTIEILKKMRVKFRK
ncbi:cysteine desulfurase family protein [Bacteroidota bacterium]